MDDETMTKNEAIGLAVKGITHLAVTAIAVKSEEYSHEAEYSKLMKERWNYYQSAIDLLESMKDKK